MLNQLDKIPWGSLKHAYGFAEDVPEQLRGLLNSDSKIRENSLWSLYGNIFHQGTRYQACLLYTSPSPRDATLSRMPSSA